MAKEHRNEAAITELSLRLSEQAQELHELREKHERLRISEAAQRDLRHDAEFALERAEQERDEAQMEYADAQHGLEHLRQALHNMADLAELRRKHLFDALVRVSEVTRTLNSVKRELAEAGSGRIAELEKQVEDLQGGGANLNVIASVNSIATSLERADARIVQLNEEASNYYAAKRTAELRQQEAYDREKVSNARALHYENEVKNILDGIDKAAFSMETTASDWTQKDGLDMPGRVMKDYAKWLRRVQEKYGG